MGANQAHWSADGSVIPELEIHTRKKHEIYSDYLHDWILTICGNHRSFRSTVTIIDGFCGGSTYRVPGQSEIWYGSPVRIFQAIQAGLKSVAEKKGKVGFQLDYKVVLIDNQKEHLGSTRKALEAAGFGRELYESKCELICGDFSAHLPYCRDLIQKRRGNSMFLIDPFGYTDFTMRDLNSIMRLGRTEIFLTFMIEFVQRFMTLKESELQHAFEHCLEARGFFDAYELRKGDALGQQIYLKHESQRLIRERVAPGFLYAFSLMHSRTRTKYYLFHMANIPRATQVVKDALWHHNNFDLKFAYGYDQLGLGHMTPDYLEDLEQQKLFVIEDSNAEQAKKDLLPSILEQIESSRHGISLQQIEINTMQENPALSAMYADVIRALREEGDIGVLRDGRTTKAYHVRPSDVLLRVAKQFWLPGFR